MRRAPLHTLDTLVSGLEVGQHFTLPEATAHYLEDVLRLPAGEVVELFDGAGLVVEARLLEARGEVELVQSERVTLRARPILLCQAMPKGERWEWVLEKCTELGVHAIYPVRSVRTVVKIAPAKQDKKLARWTQIIEGAARQSGRALTPSVHEQDSIRGTLSTIASAYPDSVHLVAALHRDTMALEEALEGVAQGAAVCLWVGPEGGWTGEELEELASKGARFVGLGPRVLRAETAAMSLLALTQYMVGDWG